VQSKADVSLPHVTTVYDALGDSDTLWTFEYRTGRIFAYTSANERLRKFL